MGALDRGSSGWPPPRTLAAQSGRLTHVALRGYDTLNIHTIAAFSISWGTMLAVTNDGGAGEPGRSSSVALTGSGATVPALAHGAAWRDVPTRRALSIYVARAVGLLGAGVLFAFAGSTALDANGDTKPGIPEYVPFIFVGPALCLALLGTLSLLNSVRMAWVVARRPWLPVQAHFEELEMYTPNGQPVLHVSVGDQHWILTLAAMRWRWGRFTAPGLLLAATRGRGGVLATRDRRSIAWAGRSLVTAYMLRRR